MAADLPEGTVTMVFTDIEGSTRLLAALGHRYADALADHRRIVRGLAAANRGAEVDTQGDAFLLAFPDADHAVAAAVGIQRGLAEHRWPDGARLQVRIGIHTGTPARLDQGYVGIDLHVGARVSSTAHGGQVVLSREAADALTAPLPDGVRLRELGSHRLKDLDEPVRIVDLVIDGLPSDFPSLRTSGRRDTNLPPDLPELRFRDAELAEAVAALSAGSRLLTLTGPGGTGKTTLAVQVGRALLDESPDGVFLVQLSPLEDPSLVPSAVAQALGVRDQLDRSRAEVVMEYLEGRRALLILDNFEHLLEATAFVDALLSAAPRLRVLMTSRVATRLPIERELPVQPLSTARDAAGTSAAAELFVQRATTASPGFRLDDGNRAAVQTICEQLDGLPLAIELAAARVRLMSPQAIADRLVRPLEVAAGGSRTREARQQTLRAAIAWGYDLLGPDEQALLAALGVFAGPFSLEAAEAVCDATLDDLAVLLDNSLLRSVERDSEDARLQLLFTIRAFARERLVESGRADRIRARHAEWCADLGRAAGTELLDGGHERFLARFDAVQDDLRAALDWLAETGRHDEVLSICADVAIYWDTRGLWVESRERLERALRAAPDAPVDRRARALFNLGRIYVQQGDTVRADATLQEALEHYRAVGDARGITLCTSHLAWSAGLQPGRYADCLRLANEALAVARRSGDPWTIAVALNNLADEDVVEAPEERYALLRESADLRRTLGERRTLAITLENLGKVEVALNRMTEAKASAQEALGLALDIGFAPGIAAARQRLAAIALRDGDLESAEAGFEESVGIAERLGDLETWVGCLRGLASVAEQRGDLVGRDEQLAAVQRLAETRGVVLA